MRADLHLPPTRGDGKRDGFHVVSPADIILEEQRRTRLTRAELVAEQRRRRPACLCLSIELRAVGCVCASAQKSDEDES